MKLYMRSLTIIVLLAWMPIASAQTWFTGNPYEGDVSSIEDGHLVSRIPITILDPPKIDEMKVEWDGGTANWKITLLSNETLAKDYKPCRIYFDGWNSYTVSAGDRDGGSFLVIYMKSYEHSIALRDALTKQFKLASTAVSTDPKDSEKILD